MFLQFPSSRMILSHHLAVSNFTGNYAQTAGDNSYAVFYFPGKSTDTFDEMDKELGPPHSWQHQISY